MGHVGLVRLLRSMNGHRAAVNAVVWSRRGRRLYSAGADGTIREWDPTYTGYEAVLHMRHTAACSSGTLYAVGRSALHLRIQGLHQHLGDQDRKPHGLLEAAPRRCLQHDRLRAQDGHRFASCSSDGTIRVWDPDTSRELTRIGVGGDVEDVAISPDGATVSAPHGNAVFTWCVSGNELMRRFLGNTDRVTEVRYSWDGTLVACASSDKTAACGISIPVCRSLRCGGMKGRFLRLILTDRARSS